MPGYLNDTENNLTYILWGDAADIFQYDPPETCPMPQTEKLSNYILRFIQTLNLADFLPAQRIDRLKKLAGQKIFEGISQHDADVCDAIGQLKSQIGDALVDLQDNLDAVLTDLNEAVAELGSELAGWGINVKFAEIVEQLTLLQVDFNAVKLQIDRLYIDEINVETSGGVGSLEGIEEAIREGLVDDFYGDGDAPILRDIEQELVNIETSEDMLEIGRDAYYLKSKVIRS